MKKIAGIRFKKTGKIYYFDPEGFELKKGMNVIVDTAMGEEIGEVVIPFKEVDDDKVTEPLKKVIRIVNDKDRRMYKENKAKEPEAKEIFEKKVKEHGLKMKLMEAKLYFILQQMVELTLES